jgi:hypothetical protein
VVTVKMADIIKMETRVLLSSTYLFSLGNKTKTSALGIVKGYDHNTDMYKIQHYGFNPTTYLQLTSWHKMITRGSVDKVKDAMKN